MRDEPADEDGGGGCGGGEDPEWGAPAGGLADRRAERHADDVGQGQSAADHPEGPGAGRGSGCCGGTTEAIAQNAPVANAVSTRAASTTAKLELSATTTWARANTASARVRLARREPQGEQGHGR